jgi:hypothetical protein
MNTFNCQGLIFSKEKSQLRNLDWALSVHNTKSKVQRLWRATQTPWSCSSRSVVTCGKQSIYRTWCWVPAGWPLNTTITVLYLLRFHRIMYQRLAGRYGIKRNRCSIAFWGVDFNRLYLNSNNIYNLLEYKNHTFCCSRNVYLCFVLLLQFRAVVFILNVNHLVLKLAPGSVLFLIQETNL